MVRSDIPPLDQLIVCPTCDATYRLERPGFAERAVCARCHTRLIVPRRKAGMQIIALSLAVAILVIAATCFPFLSIQAGGSTNSVSVLGTALAYSGGVYAPITLAMIAMVVVIPLLRAALSIYVLIPVVLERHLFVGAKQAFRWVETLRPWSMAEIFVLGCAVALTKVADLATVHFGVAFWMLSAMVVLVIAQDSVLCRWSVWNSLTHPRKP